MQSTHFDVFESISGTPDTNKNKTEKKYLNDIYNHSGKFDTFKY